MKAIENHKKCNSHISLSAIHHYIFIILKKPLKLCQKNFK